MKTRKELFDIIKKNGLEKLIQGKTGKSYSNCSNELLDKLVCETTGNKSKKIKKETKQQKEDIDYVGLLNFTYYEYVESLKSTEEQIKHFETQKKECIDGNQLNEILGGDDKKYNDRIFQIDKSIVTLRSESEDLKKKIEKLSDAKKELEIFDYIGKAENIEDKIKYKLGTLLIKKLMELFGDKEYGSIDHDLKFSDYNTRVYLNGRLVDRVNIYYTSQFSDDPSYYQWLTLSLRGQQIYEMCENINHNSKEFGILPYAYIRELKDSIATSNSINYKYFGNLAKIEDVNSYKLDMYPIFYDNVISDEGMFKIKNLDGILWLCKLLGITF